MAGRRSCTAPDWCMRCCRGGSAARPSSCWARSPARASPIRACGWCSIISARRSARSRWRSRWRRSLSHRHGLLPFPIADVVIAFAPGAQDQMMLLALALTARPGLCRRAPPGALAGGDLLDRRVFALRQCGADEAAAKRWKRPAAGHVRRLNGVHSAASARSLSGRSSRSQTSTSASARRSISASS